MGRIQRMAYLLKEVVMKRVQQNEDIMQAT